MNNGQYQAISNGNSRATIDELGLTSKQIHEARQLRDAELQELAVDVRCMVVHLCTRLVTASGSASTTLKRNQPSKKHVKRFESSVGGKQIFNVTANY